MTSKRCTAIEREPMNPASKWRKKCLAVMDSVGEVVLEREETIECAMLALLTGEHFVLLGPPGTSKSKLVREFADRIDGSTRFELLLTQFTTPDEAFGPVDLVKLADGSWERVSDGMLSESNIAFLDEIYKCNSAMLNSLLSVMNERVITERGVTKQVPLISLFGASNETPEDSSLAALHDRFLFKQVVSYCTYEDSFEKLVEGKFNSSSKATISIDEITAIQNDVYDVEITAEVVQSLKTLKQKLFEDGLVVSDRKWVQIGHLLRAKAWLDGRTETEVGDIEILIHVLWSDPKEIKIVEKIVFKLANPLHLQSIEKEDQAREVFEQAPAAGDQNFRDRAENVLQQLADMHASLGSTINESKSSNKRRATFALNRIASWHKQVAGEVLKNERALSLKL